MGFTWGLQKGFIMKKVFLILAVVGSISLFAQEKAKVHTKNPSQNMQVKEIMHALNGHIGNICYRSPCGKSKVYIGSFE
jgi:hypothetical protein